MSQSRHPSSKQQNPDLLTDCSSGVVGSRGTYGSEKSRNREDQCYSKSSHMLANSGISGRDIPSSPTDKCFYESQDSGFLSSGAINSEQSICSSDDLSSTAASKNKNNSGDLGEKSITREKNYTDSGYLEDHTSSSMRLDSDCDIHEQFSDLNIKSHLNNLNTPCGSNTTTVPANTINQIQSVPLPIKKDVQQQQQQPAQVEYDPQLMQCFLQNEDGDTQLHIAIVDGFIEVIYAIIRLAPDPCLLDIPNDFRQTPLHLAVMTSQPRIVRALLVAGASPDSKDRLGNTALHLASERGDIECVGTLLQPVTVAETSSAGLRYSMAGAAPGLSCLEERNYDGQLCIHLAAAGGHVDVLRHLIWFGADINARESKCGRTALHVAAERGNHNVSKYLVSQECENIVDLHLTTYSGYTAYQLALYADHALAVELANLGAAKALSDSEESDDDDEFLFTHLPVEGFYNWGLNGSINQQAISA